MNRLKVLLPAAVLLFAASTGAPRAWSQAPSRQRPKRLTIDLLLSTGAKHSGEPIRCDKRHVILKVKGGSKRLLLANIVQFSLKFSDEQNGGLAGLAEGPRNLASGKLLLERRMVPLATMCFKRAIDAAPGMIDAVKSEFDKAKVPLPAELGGKAGQAKRKKRRYLLPTPRQIEVCTATAKAWGDKMKEIAPKTHLIETEHFRVYSAWPKSDDKALSVIYEKMYKALCKQFNIPSGENIWIGKLPVFAFWTKDRFVKFCMRVCKISMDTANSAAGFAGTRSVNKTRFRFVCLGPVKMKGMSKSRTRQWFFELLVHESTHVFLDRFHGPRHVISWVNEGLAETIAAKLVPKTFAERKMKEAHKEVRSTNRDFSAMFTAKGIPLESFYYGVAQSLTQYLIARDKKKYIRFIELIKEGKTDAEALNEAYGLTHKTLARAWKKAIFRKR